MTTVITGGLRGIGKAIAQACAERGDTIWILDLDGQDAASVTSLPTSYNYLSCNIADQAAVEQAFAHIKQQAETIDVLVNNAGITKDGMALRFSPNDWKQVLDVNLNGTFWCSQAALKTMVRQRSGVIIMLSSLVAHVGNAGQANYAASKAGIEALTRSLAREYGKRGVRVNAVAPGFIETDLTAQLPASVREEALTRISLQRTGAPKEVAQLVLFLSSDQALYITGQTVHINGGMW